MVAAIFTRLRMVKIWSVTGDHLSLSRSNGICFDVFRSSGGFSKCCCSFASAAFVNVLQSLEPGVQIWWSPVIVMSLGEGNRLFSFFVFHHCAGSGWFSDHPAKSTREV
eukprot:s3587_g6.t1